MGFVGFNQVVEANYDFAVVDSNALPFLFQYTPEVAKELHIGPDFSLEAAHLSLRQTFVVLYSILKKYISLLMFPILV